MKFTVDITHPALQEASAYAEFIAARCNDRVASDSWWNGLLDAMHSLENMPTRCALIPEQKHFSRPIHHLLYASHRIIFDIQSRTVRILRVYPATARPLQSIRQRTRPQHGAQ
jgi:hypothetical protein